MKENSIEEDILNIEKYIELVTEKNYCECNELNEICSGSQCYGSRNVAYSMKRILSDYKRVLKENEELLEVKVIISAHNRILELEKENKELKDFKKQVTDIESTNFIKYKNYISIQKIKDKIEELKAQYKTALEENSTEAFILKCQITILQELLEERN